MPEPVPGAEPAGVPHAEGSLTAEPPSAPATVAQPVVAPPEKAPRGEPRIIFNFKYQPWDEVLEWFAEQAGLSLVMEGPPHGTFNYSDDRSYTPAEAIDLLNSILLTKGYTLVRRERMLMLIDLEDGVPPNLVAIVPPHELDDRGQYELVSTLFQLHRLSSEEAEEEIRKLLGPQGAVAALPKAQQILVTETAGRLRMIRDMLEQVDSSGGGLGGQMRVFPLQYVMPDEAIEILRRLLDIPEDEYATSDGSLRVALDRLGMRLLVSGTGTKIEQVNEIIQAIDVPGTGQYASTASDVPPQLEVYSTAPADPDTALQVLQTLLAGTPGVRLAIDPKTGNLIAMARPVEHATIRATLDQLRREATRVEVIRLRRVDPEQAATAIKALLGSEEQSAGTRVEVDVANRQLLVRASEAELERIHTLLEQMGETSVGSGAGSDARVRVVPLYGPAAQRAIEQLQQVWPAVRANPIRVVTPAADIPSVRPSIPGGPPVPGGAMRGGFPAERRRPEPGYLRGRHGPGTGPRESVGPGGRGGFPPSGPGTGPVNPAPGTRSPASEPSEYGAGKQGPPRRSAPSEDPPAAEGLPQVRPMDSSPDAVRQDATRSRVAHSVHRDNSRRLILVSATAEPESEADDSQDATQAQTGASQPTSKPSDGQRPPAGETEATMPGGDRPGQPDEQGEQSAAREGREPAPIVVAPGPSGVTIVSEDTEALDALEDLLYTLGGGAGANAPQLTIYYLKYATADAVASTLRQILAGTSASTASFGGPLPPGPRGPRPPSNNAPTTTSSGSTVYITPETRLNALVVQAEPADLATIEQLLRILDQPESPEEVAAQPKPRLIPVYNAPAEELAEVIRQVYQNRLVSGAGQRGGRMPSSPQELFQMMAAARGGGRLAGQSRGGVAANTQQLAIGVDTRTNCIVVSAPEPLFQEVKDLVEELDRAAATETTETTQVVSVHHVNPQLLQQVVGTLMSGTTSQRPPSGAVGRPSSSSFRPPGSSSPFGSRPPFGGSGSDWQRRLEFFRRLRSGSSGSRAPTLRSSPRR